MNLSAFFHGASLALGLIVAIGAQNAFVLNQGLKREHVPSVVVFCAVADTVLMNAGVFGMAEILVQRPLLTRALTVTGVFFLLWYGWQAFKRARQVRRLVPSSQSPSSSRASVLMQAAAFTLLNPHVYLDTVVLLGGIGAQQAAAAQLWFALGASAASWLWFSLLGFGARALAPWFAQPQAWRVLDLMIGTVMWLLAALLLPQLW